jgi:hypothetical protein
MLSDIDEAISAQHYVQARATLNELVSAASAASAAGTLDSVSTDRILGTAASLKTQLTVEIQGSLPAVTPDEPTTTNQGDEKPEKPEPDKPKPDEPKPDEPKPDEPKPDEPKPEHHGHGDGGPGHGQD